MSSVPPKVTPEKKVVMTKRMVHEGRTHSFKVWKKKIFQQKLNGVKS